MVDWPGNRAGVVDVLTIVQVTGRNWGEEAHAQQRFATANPFPHVSISLVRDFDEFVHGFAIGAVDQFFLLGHGGSPS
ncbi:hypothetical protein D3C80_2078630 [compost metagenome]